MKYSEQLKVFRDRMNLSISKKNANELKIAVIGYAKVLRAMANELNSYRDSAFLNAVANRFDTIAVLIIKEGLSHRVMTAIQTNGNSISNITFAPSKSKTSESPLPVDKSNSPPKKSTGRKSAKSSDKPASLFDSTNSLDITPPPPPVVHQPPAESPLSLPIHSFNIASPNAAQPATSSSDADTSSVTLPINASDEWSADVFENYLPAVVTIRTDTGEGTGFFISKNGYLLTNHHVVCLDGMPKHIKITSGDNKINVRATIVDANKSCDIALLRLENYKSPTPFIPLINNYDEIRAGIDVMLIGNGLGLGLAPVTGTLKFPHKSKNDMVYSCMTNSGDSGSPIINRQGICIAIHKARAGESGEFSPRGIAFATPADSIIKSLKAWKDNHKLTDLIEF